MRRQLPDDIQASLFGILSAIQTAFRAFAETHPDPEALITAFRYHHAEAIASLSTEDVPEGVLKAYHDFLLGIAPNPDEWLTG